MDKRLHVKGSEHPLYPPPLLEHNSTKQTAVPYQIYKSQIQHKRPSAPLTCPGTCPVDTVLSTDAPQIRARQPTPTLRLSTGRCSLHGRQRAAYLGLSQPIAWEEAKPSEPSHFRARSGGHHEVISVTEQSLDQVCSGGLGRGLRIDSNALPSSRPSGKTLFIFSEIAALALAGDSS